MTIDDGWRKDDTKTVAEKIELNTDFWSHASDKLGPTIPQTEEGVGNATVEDKQPEVKFVEAEITRPKQAEPGNLEIKEDEGKTPSPVKQKTKNVTIQEKLDQTASPISESVPKTPTSRKKSNTPVIYS